MSLPFRIVITICLFLPTISTAQSVPAGIEEIARQTNERRIETNKTGMLILGGWALTNIGTGVSGYLLAEDEEWKYFHQMNAGWNIVNLAIATLGYIGESGSDPSEFSWLETIQEGEFMQKVLLLNTGLDVGYMAFGAYLWQKGSADTNPRFVGYGQSLVLQGAFLMVFDLTLFLLNKRISDDFMVMFTATPESSELSLMWTF